MIWFASQDWDWARFKIKVPPVLWSILSQESIRIGNSCDYLGNEASYLYFANAGYILD